MKKDINIFLTALMFFTRIPVPKNIDHSQDMLQKSARYFSWVGILVGVIGAIVFLILNQVFSPPLSFAFSILATILTTGSFHEDGFADCCDAFGGGWTKAKILTIMKDSRLGTYGVVGLIAILGCKFLLLMELLRYQQPEKIALSIIAAHSISRLMAVSIMQQYEYVQDLDTSKSKPLADRKLTGKEIIIAIIGTLMTFIFLPTIFLIAWIPVIVVRWYAGRYFKKWIGGYTGDCLGATQQICEVAFYISILLISKYL